MSQNIELAKNSTKALVIGGGLSGFGAACLLKKLGLAVVISDQKEIQSHYRTKLKELQIGVFDNGHQIEHIAGCDLVIVSPGVPTSNLLFSYALQLQIPILSEIDLALSHFPGKVVAVTGTNGKSTICAMMEHILKKSGFIAKAGGNFGDPPSLMIAENRSPDVLVLELSSYQLELSKYFKTSLATFTNFSADHLARHGSLEEYFKIKWSIFDHLVQNGLGILTQEIIRLSKTLHSNLRLPKNHIIISNSKSIDLPKNLRQFPHNVENAQVAAFGISQLLGLSNTETFAMLSDYKGLPFRCEYICDYFEAPIFNDSKSTNVDSTLAALNGFQGNVILMMGGQGKGESFSDILKHKDKIKYLITFGASGSSIYKEVSSEIKSTLCGSLKEAILIAKSQLENLKLPLLFSPGCASFDEFNDYVHRGLFFNSQFDRDF